MRNNTKLKTLLVKYTISFNMDDDGIFTLILSSKQSNDSQIFEGGSYGAVLSKAYSYLLRKLKDEKMK